MQDVLADRLRVLRDAVRRGCDDAPAQVQGFAARVLRAVPVPPEEDEFMQNGELDDSIQALPFGGYPALARAGFALAGSSQEELTSERSVAFLQAIGRQRERGSHLQSELAADGIALLGVADGLYRLKQSGTASADISDIAAWVVELVDGRTGHDPRASRARMLAGDLFDDRGRLGHSFEAHDIELAALDLCLWGTWSNAFRRVTHPETDCRKMLFKRFLSDPAPEENEPLRAVTWLRSLDVLTDALAGQAVPDVHRLVRILNATQGSFRRWRWEVAATRQGVSASRWLIDKEADVQAFLLAVLYPFFGNQLEDEQYLPGYGLRQGRFDFGISSLRIIVEVKIIRDNKEVGALEAQITDDLSLYFKDPGRYERMIVYVYDDRDRPEPEKYPAIQDALKRQSERVLDVVIVQRPSMIPDRKDRL